MKNKQKGKIAAKGVGMPFSLDELESALDDSWQRKTTILVLALTLGVWLLCGVALSIYFFSWLRI